jgi:hypothetical protein
MNWPTSLCIIAAMIWGVQLVDTILDYRMSTRNERKLIALKKFVMKKNEETPKGYDPEQHDPMW